MRNGDNNTYAMCHVYQWWIQGYKSFAILYIQKVQVFGVLLLLWLKFKNERKYIGCSFDINIVNITAQYTKTKMQWYQPDQISSDRSV